MGVYGKRIGPAYENGGAVPDEWANNQHILTWWTTEHEDVLVRTIAKWRWNWFWKISDELVAATATETLESWRKADRLCRKYAWYNVLMNFAKARAQVQGYLKSISPPRRSRCPLCDEEFTEHSLGMPFVERLGPDRLEFCSPCLEAAIFFEGEAYEEPVQVTVYLRKLADIIDRVPSQQFGEGSADLIDLDTEVRRLLLRHMREKPSKKCIKSLFGTWFDALVASELLDDGARKNSRGIQCRAQDGHMCHSLGEKTIDDMLHTLGIPHTREPNYPDSNYRADFEIGGAFVEYLGLAGNEEYDKKTRAKVRLAKKHRIELILIYPKDLVSVKKLRGKLLGVLGQRGSSP